MPRPLTEIAVALSAPFSHARDAVTSAVSGALRSLQDRATLVESIRALEDEVASLRRSAYTADVRARENDELRTLLGRGPGPAPLAAAVITGDAYTPYDTFIIDVGTDHGVSDGALVLTPEGIAVGSVVRTLAHSAVVRMFSAPTVRTNVVVYASSTVHALLTGQGAGTMLLSVPRDLPLAPGNKVVLPDLVGEPIGEVEHVDLAPQDAYQTVYIASAANPYELRFVLVDTTRTWAPDDGPLPAATSTAATSTSSSAAQRRP
jgi:cell shape-determining protein MreC